MVCVWGLSGGVVWRQRYAMSVCWQQVRQSVFITDSVIYRLHVLRVTHCRQYLLYFKNPLKKHVFVDDCLRFFASFFYFLNYAQEKWHLHHYTLLLTSHKDRSQFKRGIMTEDRQRQWPYISPTCISFYDIFHYISEWIIAHFYSSTFIRKLKLLVTFQQEWT